MPRYRYNRCILLTIFACWFSVVGTSCSKDEAVDLSESSKLESTELRFQLVDDKNNLLKDEATVIISRRRPDVNMLVTRQHTKITDGELPYNIFMETDVRITVLKKGYNPMYQDLTLKPDMKTIPLVLKPKTGLTVLSYNVKDGFGGEDPTRLKEFTAWVSEIDPDIIVFQELVGFKHTELSNLAKTYGHEHSYLLKEEGYPTGITSKQSINNAERVFVPSEYPPHRVHGYISAETSGINIFAVHFSSQSNDLVFQEAKNVLSQAQLKSKSGPVLIAGDYNSISPVDEKMLTNKFWMSSMQKYRPSRVPFDYRTMKLFEDSGFKDAILLNNNSYFRASYPTRTDYLSADFLGFRLDYSYLSETLAPQCDYAEIIQDSYTNLASDHYPYLLHFDLK